MKKLAIKIMSVFLCAAIAVSFSGCLKDIDVSRLVEEPTKFKPPEVSDWEEKNFPEEPAYQYQGAYMDITPVFGDKIRVKGMEYAIQQIMEAYNNPNRVVNEEPSKRGYKNLIKIYDRQDQLISSFQLSSDFLLYARADKNAPLFLFPEYAYYMLEYAMWQEGSSLVPPLQDWERIPPNGDERATYKEEMLELRLSHDIKTILVQKYGLSEAYFLNYEIYTTAEYSSSKDLSVRVYALVGYAGYSMDEQEEEISEEDEAKEATNATPTILFTQDYHFEKAVRFVYSFVDAKYFRLTEYKEPAEYDDEHPSSLESRIRAIFPYEFMEKVMPALDDTSGILLDIHRQALDYLRVSGQGKIGIDD